MNLPNKITVSRICLIPLFLIFMLVDFGWGDLTIGTESLPIAHLIGAIIFIFASVTDWIDGHYARKYNLVTNFGKFMDPIADKLLVAAALLAFVETGAMPAWIVIILIAREFVVSGFRLVASDAGIVLAAGWSGKFKTAIQMIMCCLLIVGLGERFFAVYVVEQVLIYASLILSVVSISRCLFPDSKSAILRK